MTGARLISIHIEDLDEAEKNTITSLPTVRMRTSPTAGWMIYTAHTLDHWKEDLTNLTLKGAVATTDF
jgi:hypothetical protein